MLDLTSDHSFTWGKGCTTDNLYPYSAGPCDAAPTLAQSDFDSSLLQPTGQVFTRANVGGYQVSGDAFASELCFGTLTCKLIDIFAVH